MAGRDYYEALWGALPAGLEPAWLARRLRFLLERVQPGDRVLDIGCGEGRFTIALAEAGAQVVGVDVAAEPLRRARAAAGERRLDLRLVEPEGELPFTDSSFDVVWAGEVIEHVMDTIGWLSEIRRVLRSGGRLLLSTPNHPPLSLLRIALWAPAFDAHFDPRSDHLRFYSARTLARLLEDLRFEGVVLEAAGGPPGMAPLLLAEARRARW